MMGQRGRGESAVRFGARFRRHEGREGEREGTREKGEVRWREVGKERREEKIYVRRRTGGPVVVREQNGAGRGEGHTRGTRTRERARGRREGMRREAEAEAEAN